MSRAPSGPDALVPLAEAEAGASAQRAPHPRVTRPGGHPAPAPQNRCQIRADAHVTSGRQRRSAGNWHLVHHFDTEAFERHDLARVIGQQADGVQTQIGEDLGAQAVFML